MKKRNNNKKIVENELNIRPCYDFRDLILFGGFILAFLTYLK